jgi:hypothetical protein
MYHFYHIISDCQLGLLQSDKCEIVHKAIAKKLPVLKKVDCLTFVFVIVLVQI